MEKAKIVIVTVFLILVLSACAGHQDLLAPEYPGPMQPVNDQRDK